MNKKKKSPHSFQDKIDELKFTFSNKNVYATLLKIKIKKSSDKLFNIILKT